MHPATLHNLAYRMLDVSDSPGWQELARAGVKQSLSGQGFLSDVGFTLEHVRL